MSVRREPDPQSIVDWCARQGLDARLIPRYGGLRIIGRLPDGPGWIARVVEFVRDANGVAELVRDDDGEMCIRRTPPRLVAITELPPQSWLAEMSDPAVIE